MGARPELIVPLTQAAATEERLVGGKGRTLGRLIEAGHAVPRGFSLTVEAYELFLRSAELEPTVRMELGRKLLSEMRWEEIWDAALRIRAAFLAAPVPDEISAPLLAACRELGSGPFVVRSSAPGEDSEERSFAGLHESLVGVEGDQAVLDAVRIVWASLWSDAALLYRRELELDVASSRMAVVVQVLLELPVSGVGFGLDPRSPEADRMVIEAVPGLCEGLVSGAVDPDRWILKSSSGEIIEWRPGDRGNAPDQPGDPILDRADLDLLHRTLLSVEELLGAKPDVEWTGRAGELTLLQARPVTASRDEDSDRAWYLTLRPGDRQLRDLCKRVSEDLIPRLAAEGERLTSESIEELDDDLLALAIENRHETHEHWKRIYKDEFIPFAHGVRHLGVYYNDVVHPDDPYEFVGLLEQQPMIASQRNAALESLAARVRRSPALGAAISKILLAYDASTLELWRDSSQGLRRKPESEKFCIAFDEFLGKYLDLTYGDVSLDDRPDLALGIVLQLAARPARETVDTRSRSDSLEAKLLDAVGSDRRDEALETLRIGRLSWQLRDDDNILIGRLKNQLRRAVDLAAARLVRAGRLDPARPVPLGAAETIAAALRESGGGPVRVPVPKPEPHLETPGKRRESARQLVGQPAARGMATGPACVVKGPADFRAFRQGNIMVCDAIQPTMTHLVPLAAAIVERRGGMLIHGAIIARELGIPCVNGVPEATRRIRNGDIVTVDGHLGIVTVGEPEFDLESMR